MHDAYVIDGTSGIPSMKLGTPNDHFAPVRPITKAGVPYTKGPNYQLTSSKDVGPASALRHLNKLAGSMVVIEPDNVRFN